MRVPSGESAKSLLVAIASGRSSRRSGATPSGLKCHAAIAAAALNATAAATHSGAPRRLGRAWECGRRIDRLRQQDPRLADVAQAQLRIAFEATRQQAPDAAGVSAGNRSSWG